MAFNLPTILADRRFRSAPFLTFIATFVALNIPAWSWHTQLVEDRRANLLIPKTPDVPAAPSPAGASPSKAIETKMPRYDHSVGHELGRYLPTIPDATRNKLVILMGMSQMYAINDYREGYETISEHLDDYYAPRNTRVYGLAAPNLNNEEALLLLLASISSPQTTPAVLIYGVCFDKFRNEGVRPDLLKFMLSNDSLVGEWRRVAAVAEQKYPAASAKMRTLIPVSASTRTSTSATAQPIKTKAPDSTLESRIRALSARGVPLVDGRTDLNGYFQDLLYKLRNKVFHISATTKRPILQSAYDLNQDFLAMLADVAAANDVRLVLYVIPLNPRANSPYVPEQYEAFKKWLSQFARQRSLPFANLENAVPADEWGLLNGGPDFKHFKESGHIRTADAIRSQFDSLIAPGASTGQPH